MQLKAVFSVALDRLNYLYTPVVSILDLTMIANPIFSNRHANR